MDISGIVCKEVDRRDVMWPEWKFMYIEGIFVMTIHSCVSLPNLAVDGHDKTMIWYDNMTIIINIKCMLSVFLF